MFWLISNLKLIFILDSGFGLTLILHNVKQSFNDQFVILIVKWLTRSIWKCHKSSIALVETRSDDDNFQQKKVFSYLDEVETSKIVHRTTNRHREYDSADNLTRFVALLSSVTNCIVIADINEFYNAVIIANNLIKLSIVEIKLKLFHITSENTKNLCK